MFGLNRVELSRKCSEMFFYLPHFLSILELFKLATMIKQLGAGRLILIHFPYQFMLLLHLGNLLGIFLIHLLQFSYYSFVFLTKNLLIINQLQR